MITKEELNLIITDLSILEKQYILRDGFAFTSLTKPNIFDALIVREDTECASFCEAYSSGTRTLHECIELLNRLELESAVFITNIASLIKQCPSVKHFTIYTADDKKHRDSVTFICYRVSNSFRLVINTA